jgi:ABC-2 type transport system ATP-binding protein
MNGDHLGDTSAISVENVHKSFGTVVAVDGIAFTVSPGEVFGFLGPNGAGKTTTINMLTGLARPDGGIIQVGGIDCTRRPKAAQHLMGIVPDESNLYPELTGFENLCFCAALYGLQKPQREARARDLLERFGLADVAERNFAAYSRGMKRKLTIAAGIIHNPPILFLDEPTTGIDVASARQIRRLIADLNRSGTTVFLTTHYIEEAERLCGRIAFIVAGRLVRVDALAHLIQPVLDRHVMLLSIGGSAFPHLDVREVSEGQIRVESAQPIRVGPLVRFLEDRGGEVTEARKLQPSLEDVFVRITGIETDAMRKEKEKAGGGA